MPTPLDTKFRALGKKLINSFGTSAKIRRRSRTYEVSTGKATVIETDHTVKISPPAPVAENRIQGVVQAGDALCMVAAEGLPIVPDNTTDSLVWDSHEWQVVEVNPIVSGDQVAVYELFVRK